MRFGPFSLCCTLTWCSVRTQHATQFINQIIPAATPTRPSSARLGSARPGLRSSVRGSPRAFLITRRADKFPWLGQRSWHLGSHRKSGHNRRAARKSQTNDYNSCQFLALSLSPRCAAGLIDESPDSDAVVDDAIDCLACLPMSLCRVPLVPLPLHMALAVCYANCLSG